MVRSEAIADNLRNEIISGRFPEGAPLREINLARRFDVGRASVREALQQLVHEGLVVAKPNCGARVAPAAPDSIAELVVPLRKVVETFALRSCFHDLREADFEAWDRLLDDMRSACLKSDYPRLAELDIAFHRSIIQRAKQPDLLAIWMTLVSRLRQHFHNSHREYDEPIKVYYEHLAIVAVFRTGKLDAAVDALGRNIE